MNAHNVPRVGLMRARGEHLQAANDRDWMPWPWWLSLVRKTLIGWL
jgi:hypothetical protein